MSLPIISTISPVYNEKENLEFFYKSVTSSLTRDYGNDWELILVDDHSNDGSIELIRKISEADKRVRFIRLAKNEGAHIAIAAGLNHARGQCAVVLASDLQDSPDEIPRMVDLWRQGYQSVWLVRDTSLGGYKPNLFGKLWYQMVRRLPGLADMPSTGSDMFLIDRVIVDNLGRQNVRKVAIPVLIRSLGYRQINLTYTKQQRKYGASKWTLTKKVRHIFNTIMFFTNIPIRFITTLGFFLSICSFFYACFLMFHKLLIGQSVSGWHSLMVFNTLAFSLAMLIVGILGEYIWRTFENTRGIPPFLVEEASNQRSPVKEKENQPNQNK